MKRSCSSIQPVFSPLNPSYKWQYELRSSAAVLKNDNTNSLIFIFETEIIQVNSWNNQFVYQLLFTMTTSWCIFWKKKSL